MQSREQPPGAVASENHPALIAVPAANMPLKHRKTSPRSALKILGVLQIVTGLIHVGFGSVLVSLIKTHTWLLSMASHYLYWGGLCFVISGSFTTAAEKYRKTSLVNSSLFMNAVSVLASAAGGVLMSWDFILSDDFYYSPTLNADLRMAKGLVSILMIFTLLEFCLTVSSFHLGCRSWSEKALYFDPDEFNCDLKHTLKVKSHPSTYSNEGYDLDRQAD
ncbi:membrane-spanning 4-domains subfamily A member 15 [Alligator mississippiensis]|uniref:Membrane-spanning 4-domains subfamily A member 15 n=1 Tax=Alligator mississippiensis TaxID=8496 RepID=A0A151NYH0_ALLMI|nr:membrane-spanning 4-domains subfamily A member 15 [Alligator mississippiensis]